MNLSQERKISTLDLIVWAQASGIHPSFVGTLRECTCHPIPSETHDHLEQAKECLARAQESFSEGDRAKSDYWELMVYEAIQKMSLKIKKEKSL